MKLVEHCNFYEQFQDNGIAEHYSKIMVSTFWCGKTKKFPQLKGRAIWVRNLGPALLCVFEMFWNPRNTQHREVRLALLASCAIEETLQAHSGKNEAPEDDAATLVVCARDLFKSLYVPGQLLPSSPHSHLQLND